MLIQNRHGALMCTQLQRQPECRRHLSVKHARGSNFVLNNHRKRMINYRERFRLHTGPVSNLAGSCRFYLRFYDHLSVHMGPIGAESMSSSQAFLQVIS